MDEQGFGLPALQQPMGWCEESGSAMAIGECGRGRKCEQFIRMEQVILWMWGEADIVIPGNQPVPVSGSADQSEMARAIFDSP